MGNEREIKLKVPEDFNLEDYLINNGGKLIKKEKQIDIYLDFDDLRIKSSGSALRLRISDKNYFITFKGPQKKDIVKNRDEYEVKVSDYEQTLKIFESIGIKEKFRIIKNRSTVRFNGLNFEVDDVEGLGKFVEIEVKSDKEIEQVKKIIEIAGIEWNPILKGYAELKVKK
ncbi:MAG: class IV adenylate cyclase [Nitrososphaeria archaeon]